MPHPPHREMDAKVEGRDPPEKAKETMGLFKALTKRLLSVPMSEVDEQQRLYDADRDKAEGPKKRKTLSALSMRFAEKSANQKRNHPSQDRKM